MNCRSDERSACGPSSCSIDSVFNIVVEVLPLDDVHGLGHTVRVLGYALYIAGMMKRKGLDVDLQTLVMCSLLHDVGRFTARQGEHHAEASARFAKLLLKGLGCSEEFISKVVNCILAHSYSLGVKPDNIEAMIVSDADKLDAMGFMGVYRVVAESERRRRNLKEMLEHFDEKLLRLINLLYTEEAKNLASRLALRDRLVTFGHGLGEELRIVIEGLKSIKDVERLALKQIRYLEEILDLLSRF